MSLRAPSLVVLSYALLLAAWVVGNPPPAAPDEWSHYLRAVTLTRGQLLGTPSGRAGAEAIVGATRPPHLPEETYEAEIAWVAQTTRLVHVPAGLTPGWFRCGFMHHNPLLSAKCLNDSPPLAEAKEWYNPTATYQPVPYLVPALISHVPVDAETLSRLMRTGKALLALLLIAAAVMLLWDPESQLVSLAGIVVAMTPMSVYMVTTLNPSGVEIAAAVPFAASLIRLTRHAPERAPGSIWAILAVSGSLLALSRTQGPVVIAFLVAMIVMMSGVRRFASMVIRQRRFAMPTAIVLLIAMLGNRLWEHLYGATLVFDASPLATSLSQGLAQLPMVLREQIGMFDYLEFGLPILAYGIWGALSIGLFVTAFLIGAGRQRLILLLSLAAALALPVILFATTMRHTGFGLQGRYMLPFSIVVPLLAGEILVRRFSLVRSLDAAHLFLPLGAGVAFIQLAAWWTNARRFAVGMGGPRWFLSAAEWSPPLGWWPWVTLALVGAALMTLAPLFEWIRSRPSSAHSPEPSRVRSRIV